MRVNCTCSCENYNYNNYLLFVVINQMVLRDILLVSDHELLRESLIGSHDTF